MKLYGNTDIGKMRPVNQDAFVNTVLSDNAVLTVVCDGMGGAKAGNIASEMAVERITEYVKKSYSGETDSRSVETLLRSAVATANIEIYDMSENNAEYSGMGTTVVAALVRDNTAFIVHAGDSRAYLLGDNIEQITRDHSVVQNLVEKGELTVEEAKNHPQKNMITRAVGTTDELRCDYNEVNIEDKILLVCTDGLCGMLSDSEIFETVNSGGLDGAPKRLIELANSKMSTDNITVTIVTK